MSREENKKRISHRGHREHREENQKLNIKKQNDKLKFKNSESGGK